MRTITRAIVIGTVVAAVGSIGVGAFAQPAGVGFAPSCVDGHRGHGKMGRGEMGRGDWGFHSPATHLTHLKNDLGIKPEQTAAWNTYAKVVQDTSAQMAAQRATLDMGAVRAMPNKERAAFLSDQMDQHDQARAKVKAAAEALLPSLDDAQKAKAQKELPGLAMRHPDGIRHAALHGGGADQPTGGSPR